ncbi:MAG: hypothetical protein LBC13_03600 [Clostridiales bacterium]|jgi:hypothetical protein|nr:hypothetical protein [Clostridiales bacterium]
MKIIRKLIGFVVSVAFMAGILIAIDQLAINPSAEKTAERFSRFEETEAEIDPAATAFTEKTLSLIRESDRVKNIVVIIDSSSTEPFYSYIVFYDNISEPWNVYKDLKKATGKERVSVRGKTVFIGSKTAERDYREIIF